MIALYLLISILLAWGTFHFIKNPKVNPTRASSLLSLIAIAVIFAFNEIWSLDVAKLSTLSFGASFVGMCSHKRVGDFEVVLGGLVFAFLFIYFIPNLTTFEIGGALGFSAFIAIMISRILFWLARGLRPRV